MTLLAFHNDLAVQQKYLQRVAAHAAADELVQGYGYWENGKGCAVGCTLHGDCHADYETELGVPEQIAHLEDVIFEGLSAELARTWPVRFLQAIPLGADLSLVWNRFALWLLTDSGMLTITDGNRAAIEGVAELHRRVVEGEQVSEREWWSAAESAESAASAAWSAAESAAWAAAVSARSAARSAAWSAAWSAAVSAAESAAWAAAWAAAAEAAAEAAESAWSARSAAYTAMSEKLLELLAAAPVPAKKIPS